MQAVSYSDGKHTHVKQGNRTARESQKRKSPSHFLKESQFQEYPEIYQYVRRVDAHHIWYFQTMFRVTWLIHLRKYAWVKQHLYCIKQCLGWLDWYIGENVRGVERTWRARAKSGVMLATHSSKGRPRSMTMKEGMLTPFGVFTGNCSVSTMSPTCSDFVMKIKWTVTEILDLNL
jgi:hypothetical protein